MTETNVKKILKIDSSASKVSSITRKLGDETVRRLTRQHPSAKLIERDLSKGIKLLDESWVQANLTNLDDRNQEQQQVLVYSDQLVEEIKSADVIVITAPVYNFSIPAALKAWVDMICRAGLTFGYTEKGPQGFLNDRPVYLIMASGGVPFGSPVDFASGYLRHILGFIGIEDVRTVFAESTNSNADSESDALKMMEKWLPYEVTEVA